MTRSERKQRRETISVLASRGTSIDVICEVFGVSDQTVINACAEFGVEIERQRQVRTLKLTTLEIVSRLMSGNETYCEIGKDYNVSRQRVHQIHASAASAGLPVRPHDKAAVSRD